MKIRYLICIACPILTAILIIIMYFWEGLPKFISALPTFALCICAAIDLSNDDDDTWFDKKISLF